MNSGLNLEQSFLLQRIIGQKPLTCFLNANQPYVLETGTTRTYTGTPYEIIAFLYNHYRVRLSTNHNIHGQSRRWGNQLSPSCTTLLYDGESGHSVVLYGIEEKTNRFIFWDPQPPRSFLCAENNRVGVAAEPVASGEPFWTISADEFAMILYAVFVEMDDQ